MVPNEFGTNLAKKMKQLESLDKVDLFLQNADDHLGNANQRCETAIEKYHLDEFEEAKKSIDVSNMELDLAESDIVGAQQEVEKGIVPKDDSKEPMLKAGDALKKIVDLRTRVFELNNDVQWLISLELEIQDAEDQSNWELYRLYVLDALAIKVDSPRFIRYREKYESTRANPNWRILWFFK